MRADDIISSSTVATGQFISAFCLTVVGLKASGLDLSAVDAFAKVKLSGEAMDWAALVVLIYLAYAHLTNWTVDMSAAPELVTEISYFGDHQDSWDCENPPLRGRIINAWIALRGGFGYTIWLSRVSLVYGLHLGVPAALWTAAAIALVVS